METREPDAPGRTATMPGGHPRDAAPESAGAIDKRVLWHPFTQMRDWCAPDHEPLVLVDGEGAVVRSSDGREFIDGNSSIWTNIHGHRHPRIDAAIRRQLERVAHVSFLGTTNRPAIELAARLIERFPGGRLSRVFFSDDGSTAIECALRMALQFRRLTGEPGRDTFVVFDQAYHGDTLGAAGLGGIPAFHERLGGLGYPVRRVAGIDDLEAIGEEAAARVAGVVIEPLIQGAAGMRVWPPGMLRRLAGWCAGRGVHLILDEVMTGFGRTGTLFACEQEGVVPDFVALAKGLTGGYLPLAATLTTEAVFEAFLGDHAERRTFFYGHSYTGNALGCAAALASLEVFDEEDVLGSLQPKIRLLSELLRGLERDCPHVGGIRQCGFMAGIDLVPDRTEGARFPWEEQTGARVCLAARRHGLLTRPILDTVVLMPPLCTTEGQLRAAVEAIRLGVADVLGGG